MRLLAPCAVLVVSALAPAAFAVLVPGGGPSKSDCYVELDVADVTAESIASGKKVTCTDGAPCDKGTAAGSCTFRVAGCILQTDPLLTDCVPPPFLSKLTMNSMGVPLPSPLLDQGPLCGDGTDVEVSVKKPGTNKAKPGKRKLKLKAKAGSGSPKTDTDKVQLICAPSNTTTTTLPPGPSSCPANAAGGPNVVRSTMLAGGSDLDSGWTGTSFNFPIIQDVVIEACLDTCDLSTNPVCNVHGPTGAGTFNTETLGPPLPLVSGGVGVCVVNKFKTTGADGFTGTINLQDGVSNLNVDLISDVFVTDRIKVCPRCETDPGVPGTCDGGPNQGKPCTYHGQVRVEETLANNKIFRLSRDCPPFSNQFLAGLDIPLRPTTGTAGTPGATGGSKPCPKEGSKGVTVQDDNCNSGCGSGCSGNACVAMQPDPRNPALTICVDIKGGLSQLCCNGASQVPCHPTAGKPAGDRTGITREGAPKAGDNPWPDPNYPKNVSDVSLVTTFCIPATGSSTVDIVSGLPGPGAVIFSLDSVVDKTQ